ncbi:hypothetical protein Vau01_098140 [Virgisporangium aurantiacum]|uniref:Ig-like domain-containing protein n=1 Tax=Virgisporangium aurantiacum TaxID=175570 RepID=A0A8J3ZGC1_9ACTN|nr:hypothetical protein Vau01_098140 [Virgisporangium aurantiacum]
MRSRIVLAYAAAGESNAAIAASLGVSRIGYTVSAGGAPVTCSPTSGSQSPFGRTVVTCTAGPTTGTFAITVSDRTPPMLTLPATLTADATTPTGTPVAYNATAFDTVDDRVQVTCSPHRPRIPRRTDNGAAGVRGGRPATARILSPTVNVAARALASNDRVRARILLRTVAAQASALGDATHIARAARRIARCLSG